MLEKLAKFQILFLALVLAIGLIVSTVIVTRNMSNDSIFVTGSYSQKVVSDSGTFEIYLHSRKANKVQSYADLNRQIPIVKNYLQSQGFQDSDIEVKSPSGYNIYELTYNGLSTNNVIAYDASRTIIVKSKDVQKIKKVASSIDALNAKNVDLNVNEPSYFYSKLSDLKIEMLAKATKNAQQRAEAMLKATNNKVGKIKSVNMGVFQITPVDSTDVSDSGISDTTSIEKKVTSVANVTFRVR